jgi:hypothetical protein
VIRDTDQPIVMPVKVVGVSGAASVDRFNGALAVAREGDAIRWGR